MAYVWSENLNLFIIYSVPYRTFVKSSLSSRRLIYIHSYLNRLFAFPFKFDCFYLLVFLLACFFFSVTFKIRLFSPIVCSILGLWAIQHLDAGTQAASRVGSLPWHGCQAEPSLFGHSPQSLFHPYHITSHRQDRL